MKKIRKEDYLELAIFLAHYHSGQGSRGYRLLSKLKPRWLSADFEKHAQRSDIYIYLVEHYANRV